MTGGYYGKAQRWQRIAERLRREAEVDAYERLIGWYFAQADQKRAIIYAWQVSRMDAAAVDVVAWHRYGLFQLTTEQGGVGPDEFTWLLNPVRNVACASRLVREIGWQAFDPVPTDKAPEPSEDLEDR